MIDMPDGCRIGPGRRVAVASLFPVIRADGAFAMQQHFCAALAET
jgi:hypothetical protein